jgi:hypothetical protein
VNHIGDTNKMVSDTPRTDAACNIYDLQIVAEDIERELNAANERITQLEQENDAMRADLLLWENGGPLP